MKITKAYSSFLTYVSYKPLSTDGAVRSMQKYEQKLEEVPNVSFLLCNVFTRGEQNMVMLVVDGRMLVLDGKTGHDSDRCPWTVRLVHRYWNECEYLV